MKTIYKLSILLLFVSIISCDEEEFLSHEYENTIVDENFLTLPSHADQAIIAVYNVLQFQGLWNWNRIMLGSSAADDIVEDHGDPGWPFLIDLDKYRWYPENLRIWEHWADNYSGILQACRVIEKVPEINGMDEDLTEQYVAEAKAIRALYYYNLVTAHGDVPLWTKPLTYKEATELVKAPAQDVWDQIIKDLTEAEAVLPDIYTSENDKARVTKGFANAMLSTVYLWQKNYPQAIVAAEKVINSPAGYDLEPVYADLFNGVSEWSAERIFGIVCNSYKSDIWNRHSDEGNRNFLYGPYFTWSWFTQPSRDFIDNGTEPGDVRVDTMTLDHRTETFDINNDGVIDDNDAIPANPPVDAHIMKLVPVNENLKDGKVWSGGLSYVDNLILRYSEVLLNYAEALIEDNKASDALPYLNQVRNRAGLGDITTTDQQELREIILHERMVEFCFEGKRFFDLKRVGKLNEFLGPLGFKEGVNENFPIPQQEIDLTKMEQIDGY